jgi:CBS domain-containing protein
MDVHQIFERKIDKPELRNRHTVSATGRLSSQATTQCSAGEVEASSRVAATTPVSAVMKSVLCVRPELEIDDLETLLLEQHVSGVPVVDEKGFLVGVVSKTDLVRHEKLDNEQWVERMGEIRAPARVAEIMTRHPASVGANASIAEAVQLMLTHRIHRLPVVSEAGEVLAIVTPLDVLGWVTS